MIPGKKTHAMRMLQLVLTLSLLQVDPGNYFHNRIQGWDDRFELRDGDGWVLEMLHAAPMVDYPYANHKTMMPLIDDLVRFDRHLSENNHLNVTAYLLDVQSDNANQTQAMQELQVVPTPSQSGGASNSGSTSIALDSASANSNNTNTTDLNAGNFPNVDAFLTADNFLDHGSIWEQNLADLNDYSDISLTNPYFGLPLKDEPHDNNHFDVQLDVFLPDFLNAASNAFEFEGAVAPNDTAPNPQNSAEIKVEPVDHENEKPKTNVSANLNDTPPTSVNSDFLKEEDISQDSAPLLQVDLSPFISQVELTKEESEIVEVLWKQDVDLGYSLNTSVIGSQVDNSDVIDTKISGHCGNNSEDDIEKLKALEELKSDKPDFETKVEDHHDDNSDEWAGIPFTVDNETGEYIRLPLDELLNDVLQLAELAGENNEFNNEGDSIASTSKAAASINKYKPRDKDDGDGNEHKENSVDHNNRNNNNDYNKEGDLSSIDNLPELEIEVGSPLPSPLFDLDDEAKKELADFDIMIQSAVPPFHHHHHPHPHRPTTSATVAGVQNYAVGGGANSAFHRQATGFHHGHHQGRMPLSRGVSMEQRLQDIASLFNPIPSMGIVGGVSEMPPYPHYAPHHYAYQGASGISAPPPQHSQYPPPPSHPHHHGHHAMLHPNANISDICPSQPHYGHNLGSAVSSSMHLTNTSHESDVTPGGAAAGGASNVGAYKMEHEMMYYSNASSDMNHTTDGFINSIFNDEDLHLMDMNVNDNFCRMVDVNNTSNNSSILGLSGSHASGVTSIGTTSSANGVAMSEAAAPAARGMTADLMNSGAQGGDRLDASSDSAVSSMGSERVPSLSDGEWGEGSDSAQDYHQGKYGGPYDYSYNTNNSRLNDGTRQPPVAQKKHQMFGKRILNEQPHVAGSGVVANTVNNQLLPTQTIKYEYEPYPPTAAQQHNANVLGEGAVGPVLSKEHQAYDLKYGAGAVGNYSLDFSLRPPRSAHDIVHHNHTYTLPQGTGSLPRPQQRDKKLSHSSSKSTKSNNSVSEEEHLTRDEKRARALNIPIAVNDIINLPMDEFNERLSKYDLTENQLSLIRDIRRRGKNKVAAQNCRKRKLDQILSLEDEVKEVRKRKEQLYQDRDTLMNERKRISNKFAALHRHIFHYLRDPEGNPCSPSDYSLQQAADGSIYLLPRDSSGKADITGAPVTNNSNASNGNENGTATHLNHQLVQHQQQNQHLTSAQQQQQHTLAQPLTRHATHQPPQLPQVPHHHQGPQKD